MADISLQPRHVEITFQIVVCGDGCGQILRDGLRFRRAAEQLDANTTTDIDNGCCADEPSTSSERCASVDVDVVVVCNDVEAAVHADNRQ